jgi:hypothetical protein
MITLAFWIGSKALFRGQGFSLTVCGLCALPFDLYFLSQALGYA